MGGTEDQEGLLDALLLFRELLQLARVVVREAEDGMFPDPDASYRLAQLVIRLLEAQIGVQAANRY